MKQGLMVDNEYISLLKEIKEKVKNAQIKASVRVNSELILMYWELGKSIVKKQAETNWGDGLIVQLSKDLISEFPEMKGFSETNLKYIRLWYIFYAEAQFSPQLVDTFTRILKSVPDSKFSPQLVDEFKNIQEVQISQQVVSQIKNYGTLSQVLGEMAVDNEKQKSQQVVDQINLLLKKLLSLIP